MLSIQTNVNSLVAQQNLGVNSAFQSKTIQQLTSGYRINSSGDDAAGLAIANKYRNNITELNQGVSNGNDGVAQLQIMDGGMSNISQILDRLKTLATQSASASFTGDRNVLNNEFQTDISEIDRQAQSIGLDTGGTFAKSLAVYIGTGSGSSSLANGIVNVDLAKSTVDSQSLGLKGVQAVNTASVGGADYDLSNTSSTGTSVAKIVSDNQSALIAGNTQFTFRGPGFGDTNGITVSVNMNGVSDTSGLVTAINSAIQAAGNQPTGAAASFKEAGVSASIVTDSSGRQQLAFSSSNAAFQVQANDAMSNALMGNFANANPVSANSAAGKSVASAAAATGNTDGTGGLTSGETLTFSGGGLASPLVYTIGATTTVADFIGDLENGTTAGGAWTGGTLGTGADLTNAGFKFTDDGAGNLSITNSSGQAFTVTASAGADGTALGFGGATLSATSAISSMMSGGAYQIATTNTSSGANTAFNLNFGKFAAGDSQAVTISATDAAGNAHQSTVTLKDTTATDIDQAINVINQQLQKSNDPTLQSVTAVKVNESGTEKINFVSTNPSFSVSLGTAGTAGTSSTEGIYTSTSPGGSTPVITATQKEGVTLDGKQVGSGNSIDITTMSGAQTAITAVSSAVTALGNAQAAIGKGENQLNYAINLATSQITNFSSAESQIRDANVAQQAANLTKAQVLQQASIAAMAQANSAPQQLLTLLRG